MRHDSHFVESLAERFGESIGRFISIEEIETNPDQPRTSVGDLKELAKSIEAKGVLEPLLVRPIPGGRFRIIAGERRFRAALEAGDRKSTRLNSSHGYISYAVFCLKKKR